MLMNVVYGLVQKSEQKHITKKSVRLHKQGKCADVVYLQYSKHQLMRMSEFRISV